MNKYYIPKIIEKKVEFYLDSSDRFIYSMDLLQNTNVQLIAQYCVGGCFPGSGKIRLQDGSVRNISQVKKGDKVISFDLNQGKFKENIIKDKQEHIYFGKYIIVNDSFISTPNHPIFCLSSNEWIPVNDLKDNDILLTYNGLKARVKNKKKIFIREFKKVYNLSLKYEPYNYFVDDFLVHSSTFIFNSHYYFK
ncbi:MAG: hypothetical protein KatS3mg091_650 [Patescibacteria group bacterium]|nr:MAG: hypothetical protein KatS3mg091_650 [Patescibacteria group bacterium]